MGIENIAKRYHLAIRKIEEALYQYKRGEIEAVKEELLFALDETIEAKQHLDNYIKELKEYLKNLEAVEESIVEAIEARYVDEERLKEIKKNYKKLLNKLVEKSLIIVETHNDGYKYN
jgi:polyribonucleotide nucleotidyltransferase